MEDGEYWRLRASEMRARAAHVKDPFVSGGFLALAEQYDLLAQDGARWLQWHDLPTAEAPDDVLAESGDKLNH